MVTETFPAVTEACPPEASLRTAGRRTITSTTSERRGDAPGRKESVMEASTNVLSTGGISPRRIGKVPVAMVLATALLVGGTYLWQHAALNDRQVALDRAMSTGVVAGNEAAALEGQISSLQGRIDALTSNGEALRARMARADHGSQHLAARLHLTEQRLRSAQTQVTALLGAPLADGRYFGDVIVVGANQSPPRLVVDLAQWLTGDAAHEAEIEYGFPPEYDNYIENESPTWHTIVIAPAATVSIIGPTGMTQQVGTGTVGMDPITLERFAKMISLNRFYNFFWFDVSNGQVTAIQEEYTS
jgi:hypothetical protein